LYLLKEGLDEPIDGLVIFYYSVFGVFCTYL